MKYFENWQCTYIGKKYVFNLIKLLFAALALTVAPFDILLVYNCKKSIHSSQP